MAIKIARKGFPFLFLLALASLAVFFLPSPSPQQVGHTLYVNSSDSTCGGRSPCFTTIQSAVDAALSGDTIQIQTGTYPEKITISGKNNFAAALESDRIVIEADPTSSSGSVIVRPPAASCLSGHAILIRQSKFVTLRGLTITGATGAGVVLLGGPQQNRAVHIERSRIFGNSSPICPGGGIVIALGNPDTLVVNTLIYGNGGNGITFADPGGGPHWLIENTIHGNGWNGVGIVVGPQITLANNLITGNGQATGTLGGRHGVRRLGLPGQTPETVDLFNNLICGNRLGEINGPLLDASDSGNLTPNGNEGPGVSASPGCEIPANIYAAVNGPDNLRNTADDDFSLADNSPAIDGGTDPRTLGLGVLLNPILEADFSKEMARPAEGNADRVVAFDIGAFETDNEAPIADAGQDQTVFRGVTVTLDGSQSHNPEGASLTYQWSLVSQPAGSAISLSDPTSVTQQFTPLVLGSYVFQLIVNDGELDSAPDTVQVNVVNRSPTANAGGPYSGTAGIPIQFSGAGSDPDGDALIFTWDFGDGGSGSGATPVHTYTAAGAFNVTLTVTDPFNAAAVSQTTATVAPAFRLNPIGNKTVDLGETLTFMVTVTNPGGAPFSLFVDPLPLPNHASFNASTGVFTFTPDTTQVGSFQLNFTAVSGNQSSSETITITVPNPPPGGTTGVRGQIYNLNQTPLGNVKVTLKSSGNTAFSADDGFFTIMGVPSGRQELIINGRGANLGVFAILAVPVDLIDGVLNNLANPITLPDVDVDAEVQVSQTFTTVVSNPAVPGVELTILGGSATNSDGTPYTGKLSINPVPDYGRPESRPEELRPGMAITIQPAGIRFDPPARLTFPNADEMPPGSELNMWSLSPDTGTFNIVGKSVVSADGQRVITVEGGVSASAWHFLMAPPATIAQDSSDEYCGECEVESGSTANVREGSVFSIHTLPSYRSLGQSRSVSLTYSSVTADPRPIVASDAKLTGRIAVPNSFSTRLLVGGVQQGSEIFTSSRSLPFATASSSRLSHMFNAANLVTGRYSYEKTVFSNYQNSSIGGISRGNLIVVNRKNSPLGSGWGVSDLQQLHLQSAGGVLLTTGNGRALFFSGGPNTFTSPPRDFTTLVKNPDDSYTRTYKDGRKIQFNSQGFQTSAEDRNGNTASYAYDANNRLITITDPVGLVTTLTYGSNGKLQRITDPAGRQTLFQHDAAGNLTRITNPDATFITYAYDGNGKLTQAVDEKGSSTVYSYDHAGRFSQSVRPGGGSRGLIAGKLQGLPNTTAGLGSPNIPAPLVRSQDAFAVVIDGRGNRTELTLNTLGQVTAQKDPLHQITTTQYDSQGNPTRIVRPNGAVSTMTYDAKRNLLTSTDPVGAMTTFTYEPVFNQVKTIRDPKGNTTTINYDAQGNPIEIIDALGNRTQMTYDTRSLLTAVTSAVGTPVQTTTSFTYDARGNLLTTTNPKGDVTTLAYDSAGNVFRSTDAENRVTEFAYDLRNRLIAVLDADLKTTQYGYDAKGNLIQVRDGKNQITTFAYDGRDRLISATNPLNLTETFSYDADGNLISSTNRNGQTIGFNYDALNRLVSKTRPPTSSESGNQVATFDYDAVGNLTRTTNPATTVVNQYDAANRLVSSISATELAASDVVVPINVDTTIGENDFQFDGKTLQVNGRVLIVDGSHTFSDLVLTNGAVLRHSPPTATKVNKLDITVFGTLQIDATSRIDVSGLGFLGGGQPGNPFSISNGMTLGFARGSTFRSGGSYGGLGGVGSVASGIVNPVYGDFRNPNDVGSGGSWWNGNGGNGGGLVRIVAQTLQLDGTILANGNAAGSTGEGGGGSGGGIRLDAGTVRGAGFIRANGGNGGGLSLGGAGGGGGRVALYYQDATAFDLSQVTAFGGAGGVPKNLSSNGGAGTVYFQGPARESGELVVDNNGIVTQSQTPLEQLTLGKVKLQRGPNVRVTTAINLGDALEISSSSALTASGSITVAGALNISSGSVLTANDQINAANVTISSGSLLTHSPTTGNTLFKLDLNATTLTIDATSRIDVSGRGFLGGLQSGNPLPLAGMTVGFVSGSTFRSGGSYGGLGGVGSVAGGLLNPVYGDFRNPNDVGSGGSWWNGLGGGNGGGLVRIVAQTLQLDGSILANGNAAGSTGEGGGGSGGGIRIDGGTVRGTGFVRANGGNGGGSSLGGGGGGGGRVALYYQDATGFNLSQVTAFGGAGGVTTNLSSNGGAGTVYFQGPTREVGELVVDNNNVIPAAVSTPIPSPASGSIALTHLRVKRSARIRLDSVLNVGDTLEITDAAEFISTNRTIAATVNLAGSGVITHLPTTSVAAFKVDLSATTLTIDATSRIDVSGQGFLGGGQPGNPFSIANGMTLGFARGSTFRSGGSFGGLGGVGSVSGGIVNPVYGDFRNPNDVGSGGSWWNGNGGNGGGLVRIVAQTLQLDGSILANGNAAGSTGEGGGGSGGGIRIDTETLRGAGFIRANGGNGGGSSLGGGGGGGGRVALYYQDATGFNLSQVTAFGGAGGVTTNLSSNGGAGTVYFQGPARENGELVVDNNNVIPGTVSTPIPSPASGSIALTHLRVKRSARIRLDSVLNVGDTLEINNAAEFISTNRTIATTVNLAGSGVITHLPTTAAAAFEVDLRATTLTIDATSRIDVSGRGFLGGGQPGNPLPFAGMTEGFVSGSTFRSGGSFGGLGGVGSVSGGIVNPVYGDFRNPNDVGSGGSWWNGNGGNGGGLVRIVAQTLQLDGSILANGNAAGSTGEGGGGSGGGIRIDAGTLTGAGFIRLNGGNGGGSSLGGGGGGGGRVAVYYETLDTFDTSAQIIASGGTGGSTTANNGQSGTVHLEQTFASLSPEYYEFPVMRAAIQNTDADFSGLASDYLSIARIQVEAASATAPQRRVVDSAILDRRYSDPDLQKNFYLAMVSEGKIKVFASTVASADASVLSGEPASDLTPSSVFNPKSKIQNPKLQEDFDPIYTYDLNGNRTSMIDPTGLTTYAYDALNRLTSITNNTGVVTSFAYDALGRRTSMTHGNGVTSSYTYDAVSQLTRLAHQLGVTTVNSFDYTYDKVGNRKSKANRDGAHNYTYDALNRLAEAINPLPTNPLENYTYDPVGNRTDSNQNGLSQFNSANELNEDGDFTYQYDNNGNLTRKTAKVGGQITSYEYDAENKLVRVVSNGTTANYKYDGLGRRVEKEVINVGSTVTRYIYDNDDILLELDGSNNIVARYTHGPGIDEPLIMEKGGANFFYHTDALGTVTEITSQSGAAVQRYTYSSFGEVESQLDPNFIQPYAFTAREFDPETGLYHFRARQYDPAIGRFLQVDPIGLGGGDLNLYVYVFNKPNEYVDPFGLQRGGVSPRPPLVRPNPLGEGMEAGEKALHEAERRREQRSEWEEAADFIQERDRKLHEAGQQFECDTWVLVCYRLRHPVGTVQVSVPYRGQPAQVLVPQGYTCYRTRAPGRRGNCCAAP